jgi:hypothetical protein
MSRFIYGPGSRWLVGRGSGSNTHFHKAANHQHHEARMWRRLRFQVRDIAWLLVVASVLLAWMVDHRDLATKNQIIEWHFHVLAGFYQAETGTDVQLQGASFLIVHDTYSDIHQSPWETPSESPGE